MGKHFCKACQEVPQVQGGVTVTRRWEAFFVKLAEEVGLGFMKIVKLLQEWMNLFCVG